MIFQLKEKIQKNFLYHIMDIIDEQQSIGTKL